MKKHDLFAVAASPLAAAAYLLKARQFRLRLGQRQRHDGRARVVGV